MSGSFQGYCRAPARQVKITFAEMREQGVRDLLIYCADYTCSHSIAISGDRWPDDLRLSDIQDRFTCTACGKSGICCFGQGHSPGGIHHADRLLTSAARNGQLPPFMLTA
jgi:hypothetical protein